MDVANVGAGFGRPLRAILFDADGTLFDFQRAERHALAATMARFGLEYDDERHPALYTTINRDLWRQLEQGTLTAGILKVERFRRFLTGCGVAVGPEAFSGEYLRQLSTASYLLDGAETVLAAIRPRFRLGIVTNGLAEVQRPRLARSSIGALFDTVVVSEEIGVAKPDARIFEHALRQLQHQDRETVLMVGDSLESDIQGGVNAGIRTCWFNPSGAVNDTAIEPTFTVASLLELRDRLDDAG